eukprot:scaffold104562_cov26-Tisochrysis_lutea.AAC.3
MQDIILVGGNDELLYGQPHLLGVPAGKDVAKVALCARMRAQLIEFTAASLTRCRKGESAKSDLTTA